MSAFAYKYNTTEDHRLNKVMLIFATKYLVPLLMLK